MGEIIALQAFIIGILSALSLLVGAAASFYWHPGDRTIAFLMAVGGGALLAALSIDLVGVALERGNYLSLCFGCLIGGLLFIGLDLVVSDYGGFLRKAATTVYHVRRQKHKQYKKVLSDIGRTDVFRHLSMQDFKALSASIVSKSYKKGDILYHVGDPSEELFITLSGEVELIKTEDDKQLINRVKENQAFGRMAFITGAPHATSAVATKKTTILIIPRTSFDALLLNSPTLQQVMHRWLRTPELYSYLCSEHKLSKKDVSSWVDIAVQSLINRGRIPIAVAPKRSELAFARVAEQIGRINIFQGIPIDELLIIGSHLLHKTYQKGRSVYHRGDIADRLYLIEKGEVTLLDAKIRAPLKVTSLNGFGGLAFFVGARHTVSVMATADTEVWILRRSDFMQLVRQSRNLNQRVRDFLLQETVQNYLVNRQNLDDNKADRFLQSMVKAIDQGKKLPNAIELSREQKSHSNAGVAIWLGIMLDGIPESLVIGSSMIHAKLSLSLLIGLFVANFPEALSSSISMKQQGLKKVKILLMWGSIVLLTGIGAALGNIFFKEAEPFIFSLVEGIAAGAMLTMIAQTMMPEAYFKGGSIVGFATLLGFLAAILLKPLG